MASFLRKVTDPHHAPSDVHHEKAAYSAERERPVDDRSTMTKIKDKMTGHDQVREPYRAGEYSYRDEAGRPVDDRSAMTKIKDKLTGREHEQGREYRAGDYVDTGRTTTTYPSQGAAMSYEAGRPGMVDDRSAMTKIKDKMTGRDQGYERGYERGYTTTAAGPGLAGRVLEGGRTYEGSQLLETGYSRCPETYEVGAAHLHGERISEKIEKVELVDEGAAATRAEMIQPFKRERVIVSHMEPHTDKTERFATHYETVEKIVPVSVPTEKVTMQEVEEVLNVTVRLQEPRIERLDKTVNVNVETEVVRIVEVEKNVTVTVKVREPRIEKVTKTIPTTISTETVRMVEVEKSIPVRIKKQVPRVQQLSQTAEARIRVEKPVVDRIEEPKQHMVKVYETHERLVPAGPMKMVAGSLADNVSTGLHLGAAEGGLTKQSSGYVSSSGYTTTESGGYGTSGSSGLGQGASGRGLASGQSGFSSGSSGYGTSGSYGSGQGSSASGYGPSGSSGQGGREASGSSGYGASSGSNYRSGQSGQSGR